MKYKKIFKTILGIGLLSMSLSGCLPKNINTDEKEDEQTQVVEVDQFHKVYQLYLNSGGTLTYEEWLETVRGPKGDDGASLLTGANAPSNSLGKNGDSYIDLLTWNFYVKENGQWNYKGSLKGSGSSQSEENTIGLDFYLKDDSTYAVGVGRATFLSNITIPSTYRSLPVNEIIEWGFSNLTNLTSITIPVSIKTIGNYAFYGSSNLSTMNYSGTENQWNQIQLGVNGAAGTNLSGVTLPNGSTIPLVLIDERILANPDPSISYCFVGGFEGTWMASNSTKMAATSVANVALLDPGLAQLLASKPLKYLYAKQITVNNDAGWTAKAVVNGEVREFDGGHAFKCIKAQWNEEESTFTNICWVTDPGDNTCQNAEALTSNIFLPPYQKERDENGLDWSFCPVITGDVGNYIVFVAEYTNISTAAVPGWGFAAIKL